MSRSEQNDALKEITHLRLCLHEQELRNETLRQEIAGIRKLWADELEATRADLDRVNSVLATLRKNI